MGQLLLVALHGKHCDTYIAHVVTAAIILECELHYGHSFAEGLFY